MHRRHRQLLLFVTILILSGIMIAMQGWELASRDAELAETRFRKQAIDRISQELLTRLERIKTQEMANVPSGEA